MKYENTFRIFAILALDLYDLSLVKIESLFKYANYLLYDMGLSMFYSTLTSNVCLGIFCKQKGFCFLFLDSNLVD